MYSRVKISSGYLFLLLIVFSGFVFLRKAVPTLSTALVAIELLMIFFGVVVAFFNLKRVPNFSLYLWFGLVFYFVFSFLSMLFNGGVYFSSILQLVMNVKIFFIVILCAYIFYRGEPVESVVRFFEILLLVNLLLIIVELFAPTLYYGLLPGTSAPSVIPGTSIKRYSGFFIHPGQMAFFCLSYLFLLFFYNRGIYRNCFYMMLAMSFIVLSGQRVEILFVLILLFVFLVNKFKANSLVISFSGKMLFLLAFPVLVFFFYNFDSAGLLSGQFLEIDKDVMPRMVILNESLYLSSFYFPLGSGLATFGSAQSVDNINSVYHMTYLEGLWWYENNMYLFDFFWGSVLAESGWFGLISYFLCLIGLFVTFNKRVGNNARTSSVKIVFIVYYLYFILNTLGTPFLSGSLLMLLMFSTVCYLFVYKANVYESR